MPLAPNEWLEVARSIRKRHFQRLREEAKDARREIMAARRFRQRRAHLLWLARKHRLAGCLARLRPAGMTLQADGDQEPPYLTYDYRLTRQYLRERKAQCREICAQWGRLKEETETPIVDNLTTLLAETELVPQSPLTVRWTLEDVTLEHVWIGDIEVTMSLLEFDVHAWNRSIHPGDKRGYQHPHVAGDGRICWNGYDDDARAYQASGDFLALKDTIENLLRTYNASSPYLTLEEWEYGDGERCEECEERYDNDDLAYSERSGRTLCPNCRAWCERCEDYVLERDYDGVMEACRPCVKEDSDICALCLERFWKDELATILLPIDGKLENVPCCATCQESEENRPAQGAGETRNDI